MTPTRLTLVRFWIGIAFVACSSVATAADLRTWSDSTGKHKIKASFVSLEDGKVTLEKADGTTMEIELKKLSKADQKYVADAMKSSDEDPFKAKSDDPFKTKPKSKRPSAPKSSDDGESISSAVPRTLKVDYSSTELVALGNTEKWELDVPEAEGFSSKPKTAPLPPKPNFFAGIKGVAVNQAAGKAVVGFNFDKPEPNGTTQVAICDLATGKTTPPATVAARMVPLALHDDGQQIVMRRDEFGNGKEDRLEVWKLKGTHIERLVAWTPYDADFFKNVKWAEFLDSNHLVTCGHSGKAVIWSFPDIEPLASLSLCDGAVPAVSPDRKRIAYSNGKEVGVYDVVRGEIVAQQSTPEQLQSPIMAFSPSGKKLACAGSNKVLVWETATGLLERTIPLTGTFVHDGFAYPNDNYVLINGQLLIDLENQLKLWTYQGQHKAVSAGGWTFFAMSDGEQKPGALVAVELPHPAAKNMLKQALTEPDLFVLHKGTTVKLNLNGLPDASERERVRQALTDKLTAIDCTAGDNGTIELVATMEGPKQRQITYRRGGGDYNVQEYTGRVKFVYQGQTAWENSGTNVPLVLTLKKGENVADKLRQHEKPDYRFFDNVVLPKFLQKPTTGKGPGGSLTLGQSNVTTSGLQ